MENEPMTNGPNHEATIGFIPAERVRVASFAIMTLLIISAVIGGLMVVWDLATQDTFWRLIASQGLIAGGVCAFSVVNTIFGKRPQEQ